MNNYTTSFFDGKKEWSEIKDTVLSHYIEAYLKKVKKLNRPILLVDAFAGRGEFGDGKFGSPLLMLEKAERFAPGNYSAIFVNKESDDHKALKKAIEFYEKKECAIAINVDAQTLLNRIKQRISNHTLFLYIDPFGLKGCDFNILKELLLRVNKGHSTELLINVMMSSFHRQGAREQVLKYGLKSLSNQTKAKIENVNKAFGGSEWQKIEWDYNLMKEEREHKIMDQYRKKLNLYIKYVVSCPVRQYEDSQVKYYITFCSRHADALILMNDTMGKAYNNYMHEKSKERLPLFSASEPDDFYIWERGRKRQIERLYTLIPDYIKKFKPRLTRKRLWEEIVVDNFMQFIQKGYRQTVKRLVEERKIIPKLIDGSENLNDNSVLYLSSDLN